MLTSLELTEKLNQFVEKVSEPIKEASNRISKKEDNSAPQFLTWVEKESGSATLATWLNNLPEEALVALIREASAFSFQFRIEISWLFEHQLDEEPELKAVVSQIVLNYLSVCRQAALAWHNIRAFIAFRELESDLASQKQDQQHERLYLKLVENQLAQLLPPSLFFASKKERSDYAVQQIRQAIQTDREAFKRVFKEVLP
jgi:hypothetical protein